MNKLYSVDVNLVGILNVISGERTGKAHLPVNFILVCHALSLDFSIQSLVVGIYPQVIKCLVHLHKHVQCSLSTTSLNGL